MSHACWENDKYLKFLCGYLWMSLVNSFNSYNNEFECLQLLTLAIMTSSERLPVFLLRTNVRTSQIFLICRGRCVKLSWAAEGCARESKSREPFVLRDLQMWYTHTHDSLLQKRPAKETYKRDCILQKRPAIWYTRDLQMWYTHTCIHVIHTHTHTCLHIHKQTNK